MLRFAWQLDLLTVRVVDDDEPDGRQLLPSGVRHSGSLSGDAIASLEPEGSGHAGFLPSSVGASGHGSASRTGLGGSGAWSCGLFVGVQGSGFDRRKVGGIVFSRGTGGRYNGRVGERQPPDLRWRRRIRRVGWGGPEGRRRADGGSTGGGAGGGSWGAVRSLRSERFSR